MANKSKCPYCNSTITRLNVEEIELERNNGGSWKGVSYACPVCRKILSVNQNPEVAKNAIIAQLQTIIESLHSKK